MQLAPAPTDFKGLIILICYIRISVISKIEIKETLFKGLKVASVRDGFSLLVGPLERDSTVLEQINIFEPKNGDILTH